ncbi:hypothetical protein L7F22_059171 [Adiantum nelumboides]|nr:hypothetical protein [Adiantum nelumboides]
MLGSFSHKALMVEKGEKKESNTTSLKVVLGYLGYERKKEEGMVMQGLEEEVRLGGGGGGGGGGGAQKAKEWELGRHGNGKADKMLAWRRGERERERERFRMSF